MVENESPGDGLASKLLLDIKALTLLYKSDAALKEVLEKSFVDYSDEDVKRLTNAIQPRRQESKLGGVFVAIGEILFASFLAILGIGSFVPSMIGVQSPQQFFTYFTGRLAPSFGTGPLAAAAPVIDLAFSILLIIGALFLLGRAALELRKASLVIETSGK